jgi:acyl carrier protein
MHCRPQVREFVLQLLRANGDERPLADDERFSENGRMQSIDLLQVLLFLEERFGVDFAEIDFTRDQVGSIDNIVVLIDQHVAGS